MEKFLIQQIKSSEINTLTTIYNEYRNSFLGFLKRYHLTNDECLVIYHDSLLEMHKQALEGKLDSVNAKFKTYLFAIGKYKAYELLRKNKRGKLYSVENLEEKEYFSPEMILEEEPTLEQKKLYTQFKQLGKKCQKMLINFYYKQLSIKEIMELEGYESENTVRSQKSRCLKNLKDLINEE